MIIKNSKEHIINQDKRIRVAHAVQNRVVAKRYLESKLYDNVVFLSILLSLQSYYIALVYLNKFILPLLYDSIDIFFLLTMYSIYSI